MMIWNTEGTVAVPYHAVRKFEIADSHRLMKQYSVVASYVIATGERMTVFESRSVEDCREWIRGIEEEAEKTGK